MPASWGDLLPAQAADPAPSTRRHSDLGRRDPALNMVTTQYAKALPRFRVNAVDPGYTATDLNGHRGHQSVEDGAAIIVAMATVRPDGPTGGFFSTEGPVPW
jgi:hypothetical protein